MELKERFLKYVGFDTQSDPESETYPSTAKQLILLNYLAEVGGCGSRCQWLCDGYYSGNSRV